MSAALSCSTPRIPNTDVPDTHENREAIAVAERYRRAIEQRDVQTLLSLASPDYFEDGGTPEGDDDYGYEGLRRLLNVLTEQVVEVRYDIRYRRVTFLNEGNRVNIDYTYTGSYTLRRPPAPQTERQRFSRRESLLRNDPARGTTQLEIDNEVWFRKIADNRLELVRRDGQWRIVAGM